MELNIAAEGGSVKCILQAAAMYHILSQGHTVKNFIGTSGAGILAIICCLYEPKEIIEVICEKNDDGDSVFRDFLSVPSEFDEEKLKNNIMLDIMREIDIPFVPDFLEEQFYAKAMISLNKNNLFRQVINLVDHGGAFCRGAFRAWMTGKIENKVPGASVCTLKEFTEWSKKRTGIMPSLVTCDITQGKSRILNAETSPGIPLIDAIECSMNIPYLWPIKKWNKKWGDYNGENINSHIMVDGGVKANFPIRYLTDKNLAKLLPDYQELGAIGLLIDESIGNPPGDRSLLQQYKGRLHQSAVSIFTNLLIETLMCSKYNEESSISGPNIIHLPGKNIGTLEFNLSEEKINYMIQEGIKEAKEFLNKI